MLLLLFNNIRILLTKRSLMLHYTGSINGLDLTAGGENRLHYTGSINELNVA